MRARDSQYSRQEIHKTLRGYECKECVNRTNVSGLESMRVSHAARRERPMLGTNQPVPYKLDIVVRI